MVREIPQARYPGKQIAARRDIARVDPYFLIGALVAAATGVLHSILGERYILIRLFRRGDLPHLFGSDIFTRRTLRFAWHLTSIAWWGLGLIMLTLALDRTAEATTITIASIVKWVFLVSAVYTFVATRGRHLAWLLFGTISVALWLAN